MLADKRAHTTLPTADVERLRAWYEGVLGFTPVRRATRRGPLPDRRRERLRDLARVGAVDRDAHPDGVHRR